MYSKLPCITSINEEGRRGTCIKEKRGDTEKRSHSTSIEAPTFFLKDLFVNLVTVLFFVYLVIS